MNKNSSGGAGAGVITKKIEVRAKVRAEQIWGVDVDAPH